MRERKRIACFFTAGYTELQAMKLFMRKINGEADYIQLCPVRERSNRESIRNRHTDRICDKQSGLTGEALIDFITDFIQKSRFQEERYDAVLIEDDKDSRFLSIQPDGSAEIDEAGWEAFKRDVRKKIHDMCPEIPVIFVYAAPEAEAWFLADWDNSFGKVYKSEFTTPQNVYFSTKFRKYVNEMILTGKYRNCIEKYGFFDGKYWKLSEQIQNALDEIDFLEGYMAEAEHPVVRYSKRNQGKCMLELIDPQMVLHSCSFFFKEGFWELKAL